MRAAAKLKRGERCPIHNSFFCCGREGMPQRRTVNPYQRVQKPRLSQAVTRIADPYHTRGYRELCSEAELRRRKHRLIEQARYDGRLSCCYCKEQLTDYRQIELCHLIPKGMGGSTHDDSYDNLALGHRSCNRQNGSRRVA